MRIGWIQKLSRFLREHHRPGAPLVVACSGGSDSLGLLYGLLELQRLHQIELVLVHVDHGWRDESAMEAERLGKRAEALSIPFHLKRVAQGDQLSPLCMTEAWAREERYRLLFKVYSEVGGQALLLGHQAEDQAETVLKRILEGANLWRCSGMLPISFREGVPLWRPLLTTSRDEIRQFLQARGVVDWVEDPTNQDPKWLRSRLRHRALPFLTEQLGKSVVQGLCHLGGQVASLRDDLEARSALVLEQAQVKEGEWNLEGQAPSRFEAAALLFEAAHKKGIVLSRAQLKDLSRALYRGCAGESESKAVAGGRGWTLQVLGFKFFLKQ